MFEVVRNLTEVKTWNVVISFAFYYIEAALLSSLLSSALETENTSLACVVGEESVIFEIEQCILV